MPVTISAKKKLRQDLKRTAQNKHLEKLVRNAIKKARKSPTDKTISAAISLADKAVKKHIFHKNKVARIKASLTKLIKGKTKLATKTKTTTSTKKKKA